MLILVPIKVKQDLRNPKSASGGGAKRVEGARKGVEGGRRGWKGRGRDSIQLSPKSIDYIIAMLING